MSRPRRSTRRNTAAADTDADPEFLALSDRQRHAIDRAFERGVERASGRKRKAEDVARSAERGEAQPSRAAALGDAVAGGLAAEGEFVDEGGFVDDVEGGGFMDDGTGGGFIEDGDDDAGGFMDDGEDHGGFVLDDDGGQSDAAPADPDPAGVPQIPLHLLPPLLSSLGLPSDEDVLAVFRASAAGWDDGRRRRGAGDADGGGSDGGAELFVERKDFRAVCAALMGPDDGGADVDEGGAEEAFFPSDDDGTDEPDDDDDDDDEDGAEQAVPRKRKRGLKVTGPVKLSAKQRELARDIWDMVRPGAGAGGKGLLGRDELKVLARSLGEMWSDDEITEMVTLFSSQHEGRGLSFDDLGAVMLRANLV
ncbi:hypothetical protein Q5752_006187 [Cryptotrichosporon argae]